MLALAGYAVFGIAMTRTATPPRLAGIFVAVGRSAYLLGAGVAPIVSPTLWALAVLGSASLGVNGWERSRPRRTGPQLRPGVTYALARQRRCMTPRSELTKSL